MAFTRKFLSALGIEADKIDEIINAHVEVVEGLKEERDGFKKDAEKLADVQRQLNEANDKLAKHGEDGETVAKSDYENLKKEYDDYKTAQTAKETNQAKERALRAMYKALGIPEKRVDAIMKVTSLDDYDLDEDGKLKDADKHSENAKTEWAEFIPTTVTKGAQTATPPANNGSGTGKTREEILAIQDGAVRRAEMAKHPQLFGLNE